MVEERNLKSLSALLIGNSMINPIKKEIDTTLKKNKVIGTASTILGLTPLFFALGMMSAGISLMIGGLRKMELKEVLSTILIHFEDRMDELKDEIKDLKKDKKELENKLEKVELELEQEKIKKKPKRKRTKK